MPRKQYEYHYIYKVVCKISGKYYIGMHSTSNLEDGYFGSGKVLKRSLNKYGKENHAFEIIEYLPDRSSLKLREKELVNESLLQDPKCMNLQLGGGGGFCNEEHMRKCYLAAAKSPERAEKARNGFRKLLSTPESREKYIFNLKKGLKNRTKYSMSGKLQSDETKKKIGEANSISQKGYSNSQYGTCWITNEKENKKIHRGDLIPEGWRLGRKLKIK